MIFEPFYHVFRRRVRRSNSEDEINAANSEYAEMTCSKVAVVVSFMSDRIRLHYKYNYG